MWISYIKMQYKKHSYYSIMSILMWFESYYLRGIPNKGEGNEIISRECLLDMVSRGISVLEMDSFRRMGERT
jgi:hypothetical protein